MTPTTTCAIVIFTKDLCFKRATPSTGLDLAREPEVTTPFLEVSTRLIEIPDRWNILEDVSWTRFGPTSRWKMIILDFLTRFRFLSFEEIYRSDWSFHIFRFFFGEGRGRGNFLKILRIFKPCVINASRVRGQIYIFKGEGYPVRQTKWLHYLL